MNANHLVTESMAERLPESCQLGIRNVTLGLASSPWITYFPFLLNCFNVTYLTLRLLFTCV